MSDKIDVLDHGSVRLVDSMGSDLSVVRAARVSYDAEWRTGNDEGKDAKLIKYLYNNHHTSPFEHVTFTFEVKAPIFVFRQWHRHRTWSFNEISARYSELPEEFYVPKPEDIGIQSKDNKQMRMMDEVYQGSAHRLMRDHNREGFRIYKHMIEQGVPRELSRTVLPVATYSKMFATVNLHNLMQFIRLRDHEHAQYEIRVYAQAMFELIQPIVPLSVEAMK